MADVICRQQESPLTLNAFWMKKVNRPNAPEDAFCQCTTDSVRKPAHTRKLMTTLPVEKLKVAVIGARNAANNAPLTS